MRKVGPSLRQVAETVSQEYLADRIADPLHFLPESVMPRLFGLNEHLEGAALDEAKRFEAVEIRAISAYLMQASESAAPAGESSAAIAATEPPSAERGKKLFEMQGCLACHKHEDFPQGQAMQGPDLSRIGAKYTAKNARRWLVDWLRDPARHSPRTVMPNPRLEKTLPAEDGKTTDPAEDIAAYLLAFARRFPSRSLPSPTENDLDELGGQTIFTSASYIAPCLRAKQNVSRKCCSKPDGRSIAKRGCFGCHDIPGFEQTSQGIGPALAGWGRKPISQLAFEKIDRFVAEKCRPPIGGRSIFHGSLARSSPRRLFVAKAPRTAKFRLSHHGRRRISTSYLRMGRFNLTDAEREAMMTFVLGLTADPPQGKYAYRPDARRTAIIEGRKVLDRFACAECHTLEMERWTFSYKPGEFPAPPPFENFDFLKPHFSEKELAASRQVE